MINRKLVLEDGTVFIGKGLGSMRNISGEVVFNTSMTGYQEIITNPSYYGQIVCLTYPTIGNAGINRYDFENLAPFINGLIVKELNKEPSNFRSDENVDRFLKAHDIPGIANIDTRKLTKIIRTSGTMKGRIVTIDEPTDRVVEQLKNTHLNTELVKETSTKNPYIVPGRGLRIALVDFGVKHGILRELTKRNCHVTVIPYNYSADNILRLKPDGILLTNGPGDANQLDEPLQMIKEVKSHIPIFGIGLGHQLLALACGAQIKKMKFGHRGINYPVKDLKTNKVYVTSQNHGFEVVKESLQETNLSLTYIGLHDQTVEGLHHQQYPLFSVQFYPESSPGPEDTNYLFDDFLTMIKASQKRMEEITYG